MLNLFLLLSITTLFVAAEKNKSEFYTGGVVEYSSSILTDTSKNVPTEKYLQENLKAYLDFIKSAKGQNVDILVFPEATFNYARSREDMIKYGIELPNPKDKIAPWEHPKSYSETLQKLSKEVSDNQLYVLINLIEKEPCDTVNNDIKCKRKKPDGYNIYNTNTVFDRQGRVISRYRKYNLFNEHFCDMPDTAEVSIFETDFDVRFGHFICFDIMFKEPGLSLVNENQITNILYPSYWFSELPFLTAIQTHFGWAYANNVNFLSAGGNNPRTGTSGTGIIAGNKYVGNTFISGTIEKRLMISQLPKNVRSYKPDGNKIIKTSSVVQTPIEMQTFRPTEDWSTFDTRTWNITNGEVQRVCVHTDICCTFNIRMKEHEIPVGKIAYNYRLAANYTRRIYSYDRSCGELYCSIVACTTNNPKSCGRHFKDNTKLFNAIEFDKITITANIKVLTNPDDILIMPNTLDTSMTPIDSDLFNFGKLRSIRESGSTYERYQIESRDNFNNILTFGIYGRNYALDKFV
ncbi:vanin-like protein 1 [Condylostylus longicornis]|uniref:vanin-like protein 1 n=1 Tax=Condylostylus longicornis TaxID=2530218 RepID=UPI00244E116A|nr:vanin-like protein 1 [Condylostylus longicornis]